MRPKGVVLFDGFFELKGDFGDGVGIEVIVIIEFLLECVLGALGVAVVFWVRGPGRRGV